MVRPPTGYLNGSFDVPYLIKAAAKDAGSVDAEALIKSLESIEMVGVWGIAKFEENHTYVQNRPYMEVARGQFQSAADKYPVVIWPLDIAEASNPGRTFISVKELRAAAGE